MTLLTQTAMPPTLVCTNRLSEEKQIGMAQRCILLLCATLYYYRWKYTIVTLLLQLWVTLENYLIGRSCLVSLSGSLLPTETMISTCNSRNKAMHGPNCKALWPTCYNYFQVANMLARETKDVSQVIIIMSLCIS